MPVKRNEHDCADVIVAGGGAVGASTALGLVRAGVRTVLAESTPAGGLAPGFDDRVLAVSEGSRRVLAGLGVWDRLAAQACPIERIHVSDRGHFGAVRLRATDLGVEALGHVVPARDVGLALDAALAEAGPALEILRPATVRAAQSGPESVRVSVRVPPGPSAERSGTTRWITRSISGRLLVVADGGRSPVRDMLGVAKREHEYGQSAVLCTVETEHPHLGTAYERFTPAGPLALLPLSGRRCALVWTVRVEHAGGLLALPERDFLDALAERFGSRLGAFVSAGPRTAHALSLIRSRELIHKRAVLVGNAAHALHPIAGQGLNLGMRDSAALVELVTGAIRGGGDPGSEPLLDRYRRWRRPDQRAVTWFTDGLVNVFSNDLGPMVLARNLAMVAMDLLPPLKGILARRAMGLAGRQPTLARGLMPRLAP